MIDTKINQFNPDYAIHPGEILDETLEARGIKKSLFADKCGIANKTLSQIINGKSAITPEMAIKFERALGSSASLWINLNTDYELYVAREEDKKKIIAEKDWIKNFPIKHLIDYNSIPKRDNIIDNLYDILSFFGVGSIEAWNDCYLSLNVAYRKSPTFEANPQAVATWLRLGEIRAERINCEMFDKKKFKESLKQIRLLTKEPVVFFQKKMIELCSIAGVALIFLPEMPKTHISGVAKWLTSNKAMIILSLRHKQDDHFWFSFFHESAHILLHGKTAIFIDNNENSNSSKEIEADTFASNMLIPPKALENFLTTQTITQKTVCDFAEKINLSPGVIVGRLQHDNKIPYNWLNKLKRKFDFSENKNTIATKRCTMSH